MTQERQRAPYAGTPRYTWLRTGQRVHKGQRWFLTPAHMRPMATIWTRADQAWAVRERFFVERVQPLNQARLVSLNAFHAMPIETEAALTNRLLQELFHNPSNQRLQHLFAFVEQQDRFGWSDTWEVPAIETTRGPRQMRWLSDWYHDSRAGTREPAKPLVASRSYDHVQADMRRMDREKLGLETRKLRRIYTPGCPCTYCKATERRMAVAAE